MIAKDLVDTSVIQGCLKVYTAISKVLKIHQRIRIQMLSEHIRKIEQFQVWEGSHESLHRLVIPESRPSQETARSRKCPHKDKDCGVGRYGEIRLKTGSETSIITPWACLVQPRTISTKAKMAGNELILMLSLSQNEIKSRKKKSEGITEESRKMKTVV